MVKNFGSASEDLGSVLSAHMTAYNTLNSGPRKFNGFWPLESLHSFGLQVDRVIPVLPTIFFLKKNNF